MNWLNLNIQTLDSENFIGSEPVERATWLCLLRYCIGQENGGVIQDCGDWTDRKWQQLVRVTMDEVVNPACALWDWDCNSLTVWGYPSDKENEVRTNRENGKTGGRPRKEPKQNHPVNHMVSDCETERFKIAETERKGKEGNSNKKEKETATPDVPLPYESEQFKSAWDLWLTHKRAIKQKMPYTTVRLQLAKLAKWGESRAIQAIETAIEKNWTGFFEPEIKTATPSLFTQPKPTARPGSNF